MAPANQYRLLRQRLVTVWAAAVVALGAFGVVDRISYETHRHQENAKIDKAKRLTNFYRIIGGTRSSSATSVDVNLAYDLKQVLGPVDSNAKRLPSAVVTFRGNINSYGGITSALGTNPFQGNGIGCNECGALRPAVQANLLLIKQGRLQMVVAQLTPPKPAGYSLLWGLPPLAVLCVLWLFVSPMFMLLAWQWMLASTDRYRLKRFSELDWEPFGDNAGDKLVIYALAPSVIIPWRLYRRFKPGESYNADALRRKREVLGQAKNIVEHYVPAIRDDQVKDRLSSICELVQTLIQRIEEQSPQTLLSATGTLKASLNNLEAVIKQLVDVQDNPRFFDNPQQQIEQCNSALDSFDTLLLRSIKLIESGENNQVAVAVKQLEAAQYRPVA